MAGPHGPGWGRVRVLVRGGAGWAAGRRAQEARDALALAQERPRRAWPAVTAWVGAGMWLAVLVAGGVSLACAGSWDCAGGWGRHGAAGSGHRLVLVKAARGWGPTG